MAGLFITFEGGEGVGKTTQIVRLAERLRKSGLDVVTTREPGGSPRAEAIRSFILAGSARDFGSTAEALLFTAARLDHVERVIAPALAQGAVVICDRFIDSTRVYQGLLGGVPPGIIAAMERLVLDLLRIDLTILIDVPESLGLARAAIRRAGAPADRFEAEDTDRHARIRAGFLAIAAADTSRFVVIDGFGREEEVGEAIWRAVAARLGLDTAATPSSRNGT
jgi:dTMP kinase